MTSILDGTVKDQNDIVVAGATVYIYERPSGLADLVDVLGQPIANPVTTNDLGYWSAYVTTGKYYTLHYKWGGRTRLIEAGILAGDPPIFGPSSDPNLRTDLFASTGATLMRWLQTGTSAISRTIAGWLGDQSLSVKDFGAVGDGVTDDTAAFILCSNAALLQGRDVYIPAGPYRITSWTISITAGSLLSKFRVRGAGRRATRLLSQSGTASIIAITATTVPTEANVDLSDFSIDGTRPDGTTVKQSDGITLTGLADSAIRRVIVENCNRGLIAVGSMIVTVDDCTISRNYTGNLIRKSGAAYANDITFKRSRIKLNTFRGIDFGEGSALNVLGCDLESNGTPQATVTITNASPAVITWNAHGLLADTEVVFTTTSGLPTGITAGTSYYVRSTGLTANAFQISATVGGIAINTSSAGAGVHTGAAIGTGAVIVRNTCDDETGVAIVNFDKCWFEDNYGQVIDVEACAGLSASFARGKILASQGGRVMRIGGAAMVTLDGIRCDTPGDTLAITATRLSMRDSVIHTLTGTVPTAGLLVQNTVIGGAAIEGNFQRSIHIGGGYLLRQSWANDTAGFELLPDTVNNGWIFRATGAAIAREIGRAHV